MPRHLFVGGFQERGRRGREEGEQEADFVYCTMIKDIFLLNQIIEFMETISIKY